jgi:hypothetical protein
VGFLIPHQSASPESASLPTDRACLPRYQTQVPWLFHRQNICSDSAGRKTSPPSATDFYLPALIDSLWLLAQALSLAERPAPRLLSSGVLWRSLVAACPAATTIAFLVLLPVAAILATAATRRPKQRQADYPAKAQTQKLPATQGHGKNGIASGCRFSCIRHRESPRLARFVTILTARRRHLVPELSHDSQH